MAIDVPTIVLAIGALVFAAHLFKWLFSLTKIPNVLLLMLVGLIVGPLTGVITPDFFGEVGQVGVIIALIIILFEGGTELRLEQLRQAWQGTVRLTLLSFLVTMGVVGLFVWWLSDVTLPLALAVGAMLGGTASVVVVPIVEKIKMHESSSTTLFLESALSDVLAVVLTLGLIEAAQAGGIAPAQLTFELVIAFLIPAVIGLAAGVVWSMLLNKVRHMQNSIFTTPAFVFVLYGLVQWFSLSGLVAALAFGIAIGNMGVLRGRLGNHRLLSMLFDPQTLSRRERVFFQEIVFLLETFFFVFVGISITFANPWVIVLGVLLVLIMFVLRHPIVQIAVPKRTPVLDASIMAVMVPKGLAAAVLASLPLQLGLEGGEFVQNLVFPIIFFSVLITSMAIFLLERTGLGALHRRMFSGFGHYAEPPPDDAGVA